MGESGGPTMAPLNVAALRGEERWRHFDDSVNAVSFGFVATAILISMFLAMAIFERFLRPRSPLLFSSDNGHRGGGGPVSAFQRGTLLSADLEAQPQGFAGKLDYPSPKVRTNLRFMLISAAMHHIMLTTYFCCCCYV